MAARRSSAVAAAAQKPTQKPTRAPTQAPTLSRRHAAGAPSARGLLFTLLGEFVLTTDGTAWTSAVLAAFARLGIEEKATRQALMRTAAAGWLEAEKLGRRTRWRLTASARRLLTDGAERIYSFTGPPEAGTAAGCWCTRASRRVTAGPGTWCAAGSAGPGSAPSAPACGSALTRTVRPRPLRCSGRQARGDAHVFVATRSGLGDVRVMVAAAWDLAAIEDQYEQFIEEFRDSAPGDVLARQVELVHAWRRFPSVDPALPRELLPARWSGLAAARLFADRHQRWSGDAPLSGSGSTTWADPSPSGGLRRMPISAQRRDRLIYCCGVIRDDAPAPEGPGRPGLVRAPARPERLGAGAAAGGRSRPGAITSRSARPGADVRRHGAAGRPLSAGHRPPGRHGAGALPLRPRSRTTSGRAAHRRTGLPCAPAELPRHVGSGGQFDPMSRETSDGQDTVAWFAPELVRRPAGHVRASYLGFVQWALAKDPPPELAAMVVRWARTTSAGPRTATARRPVELPRLERPDHAQERVNPRLASIRMATSDRRLRPALDGRRSRGCPGPARYRGALVRELAGARPAVRPVLGAAAVRGRAGADLCPPC